MAKALFTRGSASEPLAHVHGQGGGWQSMSFSLTMFVLPFTGDFLAPRGAHFSGRGCQ